MNPFKKSYYYTFREIIDVIPFVKMTLKSFVMVVYQLEDEADLANYQLPSDLTTNAVYNEFFALCYGRYNLEAALRIDKLPFEEAPTAEEIADAAKEWGYKFISLLNMTYEYYVPLLNMYRDAKTHLMDDITATSKNKVKYNDTPQNANTSGVYEGDDYITQFTSTEGESTSPLTSKIMRLKDIQDHYKNVMADWVKEFEKLFFEVQ